jgi:hypothetical protein
LAGGDHQIIVAVPSRGRPAASEAAPPRHRARGRGRLAFRPGARPEGALLLRRRFPTSRQPLMRRWNLFEDDPRAWQSTLLEHHDVVVVAWSLEER